jgi:flavodoxin
MERAEMIGRRQVLAASLLAPLAGAAADGTDKAGAGILVACFTRSGNTRVVAGQIQRAVGATLFEIETARPYPLDYQQTVDQARRERDAGQRPALKADVPGLARFHTIYLGFPIWGETAPPPIRSFLARHDLKGKTLIPFITHGGYGPGNSLAVLAAHAPGARLVDGGFVMQDTQEKQTLERVSDWLGQLRQGGSASD